ncbi:hypothetical protein Premu_2362 [Hallella multisaccharivorax DSM 17128]|uniref:Uncharacterized protein n=1 Tax=Hallella multisaccharivorax DSM 17128 TaxID=688246 RepID=F8N9D4_9BACT|nr:hypothetical protein Premu_2362 [Hallella multisaccharivorax DSM 17128]
MSKFIEHPFIFFMLLSYFFAGKYYTLIVNLHPNDK